MVGIGPRCPPARKGSMHDVPADLLSELKRLCDLFTVSTDKLLNIVDVFEKELEQGLSVKGGDIVRKRLKEMKLIHTSQ